MKYRLPLFLLLLVATACGQRTTELQEKAKKLPNGDKLLVKYDEFKDLTTIGVKPYDTMNFGTSLLAGIATMDDSRRSKIPKQLTLTSGFQFKGKELSVTPEQYFLVVTSQSKDWLFLKGDRNLYVLYDDKRFETQPLGRDSDVGYSSLSESIGYSIPAKTLREIANAKKVKVKFGNLEWRIKDEFWARIADLLTLSGN